MSNPMIKEIRRLWDASNNSKTFQENADASAEIDRIDAVGELLNIAEKQEVEVTRLNAAYKALEFSCRTACRLMGYVCDECPTPKLCPMNIHPLQVPTTKACTFEPTPCAMAECHGGTEENL